MHTIKKIYLFLLVLLINLPITYAQNNSFGCSATPVDTESANFGNISSFNIVNSVHTKTIQNAGLQCRTVGVGALYQDKIDVTINSSNNGELLNTQNIMTDNRIQYSIYADSSFTTQIFFGQTLNFNQNNLLNLLGIVGSATAINIPLHLKIHPKDYNLSAGTYTDTLTINWNWDVCSGVNIVGIKLCLDQNKGHTTAVIPIKLIITQDCKMNVNDINFGTAPVVQAFQAVSGSINIICTKGTIYTVGLSNGENSNANQRRMTDGSHYLGYEIYKGNTNIRWGSLGSERRSSSEAEENSGPGWGNKVQSFKYNAEILKNQPNQPAGIYKDSVIVEVSF